ncbi:MAG TPA: hypothetical protein VFL57_20590 [Bryobacteraceae bacterium]|nr:hypothetical protein [Bryobacteraceae bacterium]
MMFIVAATILVIGTLAFVFMIRTKDLPQVAPPAPWRHLEARRAQIYENLRDLQFEFRVGKLSEPDYQQTKGSLQSELAIVLAEIDLLKNSDKRASAPGGSPAASKNGQRAAAAANTCPHCGAKFDRVLKFCGECGKPMAVKV